jgi:hypothetical protein
MAIPGIQEIQALAFKYSKAQLANMVQMGMLDPQKATMAGFMRDRIAKEDMKPPTTTVAQDALGIAPPQEQPMPPQGQPMPPQGAPMPEMAGLESLPAGNVGEYAGGGIVAFDDGGEVQGYAKGDLVYGDKTWEELKPVKQPPRFASERFTNLFDEGRRIDPFTGEEITLAEFLDRARKGPPSKREKPVSSPPKTDLPPISSPSTKGGKGSLIDPEFRDGDPDKKVRLGVYRDELAKAQQKLAAATTQEDKARAQADIDALNREIANASKSAPTKGFGNVTKIPQGDPRIAAQRDAMSLPAINPPAQTAPNNEDFVARATGVAEQVYPKGEIPKEMSVKEAFDLSNQALTEAGADLDFYTKQDKDLEKEGATFAKDREEAKTFRILQAAAGVLSGTSPFASVNIGKGVAPAVEGLAADLKEFNKNERALRDAQRKLKADQQQFNVTRASSAMNLVEKSKERVDRLAGKKADLIGDITKSFISTQGSKEVAGIYAESYQNLERMRQEAPPDVAKLADRLKRDMPNDSEKDRLEAAAKILRPTGAAAGLNASNRVILNFQKKMEARSVMDPNYRKLVQKAGAGDEAAKLEVERIREQTLQETIDEFGEVSGNISGAPSSAKSTRTLSSQDQEALDWANANPKDPRAAQIKSRLGVR